MKREGLHKAFGLKPACLAVAFLLSSAVLTQPVLARPNCAATTTDALRQALVALERQDPESEREALVCMVAAVAALDARLRGLSDGTIPFDGPVYIPQGYVMMKPQTEEAD